MASCTVRIFSASSSGISMSKASSRAITSSTVSSESAPRSSTKKALAVTSPSSTPSCSMIICFTFSSTAAMFLLVTAGPCQRWGWTGDLASLHLLFRNFRVRPDVVHRVLYGADFFRVFVGNFDVEGFFEGHDQFDGIERIRAQIVHERSAGANLALIHSQLLDNDLFHLLSGLFLVQGCHWNTPLRNSNKASV